MTTLADAAAASATDDFDRFVETEGAALRRYLSRRLSRPQDVEDIYQETLFRTWQRWDVIGTDERWRRNTLYMIAGQEAQKLRERHEHRFTDLRAEFDPNALGVTECPSSFVVGRERSAIVVRVVGSLPANKRALIATDLGLTTLADVALDCGTSEETLRQQRHRLRKQLRGQLHELRVPAILPLWRRATRESWRRAGEVPWMAQAVQVAFVGIVSGAIAVVPSREAARAGLPRPRAVVEAAPAGTALEVPDRVDPSIAEKERDRIGTRPTRDSGRNSPPKDRPTVLPARVCVRNGPHEACAGEPPGEAGPAVDTIRVHTPLGDVPVSQNYVAACESWPTEVPAETAECQTTGDPPYLVSPPTPPPGG